jgi:hypothetical protein
MKDSISISRLMLDKEHKYYFNFGLNPIQLNGFTTLVVMFLKCECNLFNHPM